MGSPPSTQSWGAATLISGSLEDLSVPQSTASSPNKERSHYGGSGGKVGRKKKKFSCQRRAGSARRNGLQSSLKGPPGQGTSCRQLELGLEGSTPFVLTNF